MDRIYGLIVRRPKMILLLIVLLTAFFAFQARHIRLDSSIESLLPHDDPEKEYYEEIRRLYGSDEIVVIGLVADNVYTPEALKKIGAHHGEDPRDARSEERCEPYQRPGCHHDRGGNGHPARPGNPDHGLGMGGTEGEGGRPPCLPEEPGLSGRPRGGHKRYLSRERHG